MKNHLNEVVVQTVEQTLNSLLEAEVDEQCGASRCERSEDRKDSRMGSCNRKLHTKTGEVRLKVKSRSSSVTSCKDHRSKNR